MDDLKAAGSGSHAKIFLKRFDQKFKLGTVKKGPCKNSFFGVDTVQNDDYTFETYANDKLEAVT